MTEQASNYTKGYSEEFRQVLNRRSMETHAKHLVPYLKPGLRVLDFGCGPGTISVGLARAVDPGEVHGIDMEESQIELARAAAEAGGPQQCEIPRRRHNRPFLSRTIPLMWPTAMPY